ncbi:hypothetical protein OG589_32180 [Sphaerisporangium sp. NBC_01403]|uniref:hypothetical protein n=1 Tax=Sphaerisporangium sp. NBC_01403 TaxID=2903599 RepID=UPI0032529295
MSLAIEASKPSICASSMAASSAWWSSNWPVNASTSAGILTRILPRAGSAGTRGLRSPAISASIMSRIEALVSVLATDDTLIRESSFSSPRSGDETCMAETGCPPRDVQVLSFCRHGPGALDNVFE